MSRSDLSDTSIVIEQAGIEPFARGTGVMTLPTSANGMPKATR
jgi:hypothetical protein